jgi:uncharacterized phage protein gp47/JayE
MSSPGVNPAPNVTSYVDLRLYDVTDQQIVDTAIAATKLNLPGWVPNEANTEVIIFEALALQIAESIVAINRLPGAVMVAVLQIAGVDRDFGEPPTATATIRFGDTAGHTVPAGTRLYLVLSDGTPVTFLVETQVDVAPGSNTGTLALIGDTFTAAANGVAAGSLLTLADRLPFVESAVLATDVADGADPETDDEWRDRGVERLARLSDALVVPAHFVAAALENPAVAIAVALDLYDPATGPSPGSNPGHMTVAVLGAGGTPLSGGAKTALAASLDVRAVAILVVHVIDATVVTVPVATEVVPAAGYVFATVQTNVIDAINAYIDPLSWDGTATKIYHNEMVALLDQVAGVERVNTVTVNGSASDYTIAGIAALPNAGTITVTQGV